MTAMYMNVEAVCEVQNHLAESQKEMAEMVATLTEAVHGLQEGAWVGNSATQFFLAYETLNGGWKHQMENLRLFNDRMKQEIDEWVNAASSLG